MAKRIRLHHLRNFDYANDESLTRELEMAVDSVLIKTDYAPQFWRDVTLYGVDEAIGLLRQSGCADNDRVTTEVTPVWQRIKIALAK